MLLSSDTSPKMANTEPTLLLDNRADENIWKPYEHGFKVKRYKRYILDMQKSEIRVSSIFFQVHTMQISFFKCKRKKIFFCLSSNSCCVDIFTTPYPAKMALVMTEWNKRKYDFLILRSFYFYQPNTRWSPPWFILLYPVRCLTFGTRKTPRRKALGAGCERGEFGVFSACLTRVWVWSGKCLQHCGY